MKRYFLVILLLSGLISTDSLAQPFKFGKISKKDFAIEHFREKYPEDYAVTIGDWANCKFIYNNLTETFQFQFERTCRIMVLDERGIDLGDVVIDYYSDNGLSEEIKLFKVNVYNLEDGKIKKEKFNKRNVFSTDVGNNWYEMRYPAPNVRPGTIVEFTYLLISDFMHVLRGWEFQKQHPVEYSFYELRLPSVFKYRQLPRGFTEVEEIVDHSYIENYLIQTKIKGSFGTKVDGEKQKLSMPTAVFQWKAEEVPAFIPEPFTDNYRNYLTSVNFEYIGQQWPDQPAKNISETWEDVTTLLYKDEDFGEYLEKAYLEADKIISFDNKGQELIPLLNKALEVVREKVSYNNRTSIWADNTPSKVLDKGQGNSAEVNLLLIALLQNKGIDARPVLLSTRQRGAILSDNPTLVQFNYVLAAVPDAEHGMILLDAATKDLPARYIPEQAVNGKGRMISKTESEWVVLENPGLFHEKRLYNLSLNDDGDMSGDFRFNYYGYGRVLINMVTGTAETDKLKEMINKSLNARVENLKVVVPDSDLEPISVAGDVVFENYTSATGNEIFLQPMLMETTATHDFNLEERKYPVFFEQKTLTEIEINLKLPDGYDIEAIPEKFIKRFGNSLVYEYEAVNNDGELKITDKTLVGVHMISAAYYNGLKNFFTSVSDKSRESIILKKL